MSTKLAAILIGVFLLLVLLLNWCRVKYPLFLKWGSKRVDEIVDFGTGHLFERLDRGGTSTSLAEVMWWVETRGNRNPPWEVNSIYRRHVLANAIK